MRVPILDLQGVKVTQIGLGTICIKAGRKWIYLTYEELVEIAEAAAQHLAEPLFTEEDLAAGHQAIADYVEAL